MGSVRLSAKGPGQTCSIEVWLKPNARHEQITWRDEKTLAAGVRAPAIEGRANAALLKLLCRRIGLPRTSLEIVRGAHSRHKAIRVQGINRDELHRRLESVTKDK